jgi:hypothetical protein
LLLVDRPKNQGNNHYSFLWREDFHRSNVGAGMEQEHRSNVGGEHRANVRGGDGGHRADPGGGHRSNVSGAYKEEPLRETSTEEAPAEPESGSLSSATLAAVGKNEIPIDGPRRGKPAPAGYAFDEQFAEFQDACRKWGMNLVEPEDFYEAYRFEWGGLDFEQRNKAIQAIRSRAAAEIDPLGWKPKNFLKTEWKREIRVAKPASGAAPVTYPTADDYIRSIRTS